MRDVSVRECSEYVNVRSKELLCRIPPCLNSTKESSHVNSICIVTPTVLETVVFTLLSDTACVGLQSSESAVYLLAAATINEQHDMSQQMPLTAQEFCQQLGTGDQPPWTGAEALLWTGADAELPSTSGQKELLEALITDFNKASSPLERTMLVGQFLVKAAELEGLTDYRMVANPAFEHSDGFEERSDDQIVQNPPEAVYLVEDFPAGAEEHGQTLAVAVLRWCRFEAQETSGRLHSKLLDLKADRFNSASERDQALNQKLADGAAGENSSEAVMTKDGITTTSKSSSVATNPSSTTSNSWFQSGGAIMTSKSADGTTTTTTQNADGSTTTITINPDGSETEVTEFNTAAPLPLHSSDDANPGPDSATTSVQQNADGSTVTTSTTQAPDGATTTTTTTQAPDGTTTTYESSVL